MDKIAEDILKAASVPKLRRAYFLGPYARRVSFASQQHRVLNLIWALKRIDVLVPDSGQKIAVVGGGLTGVMASVVLTRLGCEVTLFEARREALGRQRYTAHRYIHPTVNHWPGKPKSGHTAMTEFPYFDWHADICENLIASLQNEWEQWCESKVFAPILQTPVQGVVPKTVGDKHTIVLKGGGHQAFKVEYDMAIVTSGFSDEKMPPKTHRMRPYWQNDNLEDDRNAPETRFIVSGCGDGGLIDALRLVHKDFEKGSLIARAMQDLADWPYGNDIAKAEKDIAEHDEFDTFVLTGSERLQTVYQDGVQNLPAGVRAYLDRSLIDTNFLVKLVTKEKYPYSPLAAPIHKLLFAHAFGANKIEPVEGELKALSDFKAKLKPPKRPGGKAAKERDLNGRIVVRHGARPNFEEVLKDDPDAAEDLKQRQLKEAAELDWPYWQESVSPLLAWPPNPDDPHLQDYLNARLPKVQRFLQRAINDVGARVAVNNARFEFVYRKAGLDARAGKTLEALPKQVFGFNLKTTPADEPGESTDLSGSDRHYEPQRDGFVRPGSKIAGVSQGRLGPFVRDQKGAIFALAARHVVGDEDVVRDAARQLTLERVAQERPASDEAAADIVLLRLLRRSDGLDWAADEHPPAVARPHLSFRATCHLIVDGELSGAGRVTATEASAHYLYPGSRTPNLLTGAIKIQVAQDERFSRQGDSGAPVVQADGRLLGILIAGRAETSFVAPVEAFLRERGLVLASARDLQRARLPDPSAKARSGGQDEDMKWGIAAMQRDLFGELIQTAPHPTRARRAK